MGTINEARKEYWRHWYEKNRERQREYHQNYLKNLPPEKRAARGARISGWCKQNPEKISASRRRQKEAAIEKGPVQMLLNKLKYNAKVKGIEFNLGAEDVSIPETCPVLGIPIVFPAPKWSDGLPSFDRMDPSKGYVKGNVRVISWRANALKSNCTNPAELRAVADYVEECAKITKT